MRDIINPLNLCHVAGKSPSSNVALIFYEVAQTGTADRHIIPGHNLPPQTVRSSFTRCLPIYFMFATSIRGFAREEGPSLYK